MESKETLVKKYIKIYPSYIDKALKHSEGRKVSSSIAMENPRIEEINAVCSQVLGLDSKKENHHHPKDWMKRGRVIVKLKQDNKSLAKEVTNKNQLLKFVCNTINEYRKQQAQEEGQEQDKSRKKKKNKK